MHVHTLVEQSSEREDKMWMGRGAFYLQQTRVLYTLLFTQVLKKIYSLYRRSRYIISTYVAVYSFYLRLRNSQCMNGFRI